VTTNQEIAQVGSISANGDTEIDHDRQGDEKVATRAWITVEEAKSLETELDIVEGCSSIRGYLSQYLHHQRRTRWSGARGSSDPPLRKEAFLPPASSCSLLEGGGAVGSSAAHRRRRHSKARPLATLVVNKLRGGLRVAAVKAPRLWATGARPCFEDIRHLTGGSLNQRRPRHQCLEKRRHRHTRQGPRRCRSPRTTHHRRMAPGPIRYRSAQSRRSSARSRTRASATTRKSCRSGWPKLAGGVAHASVSVGSTRKSK